MHFLCIVCTSNRTMKGTVFVIITTNNNNKYITTEISFEFLTKQVNRLLQSFSHRILRFIESNELHYYYYYRLLVSWGNWMHNINIYRLWSFVVFSASFPSASPPPSIFRSSINVSVSARNKINSLHFIDR